MTNLNFIVFVSLLNTGCYTIKQGIGQVKLLANREPIEEVVKTQSESPARLEKLKAVPEILKFAENQVGLNVGGSYKKYVKLESDSVTYVLQVAEKKRLERKTWWFPLVGSQPYLGFFKKQDALDEQLKWKNKNFDTSLGGVEAFSLLGYIDDPLYSSMLDNNSILELAETLIHECLHRTVYIPGESEFNENLADFVGRKGAVWLAESWKNSENENKVNLGEYKLRYESNLIAQKKFQEFLPVARRSLEEFYAKNETIEKNQNQANEKFDEERKKLFGDLRIAYLNFMNGEEKYTSYESRFIPERFNNAVFLGYALYEAQQQPFESLYHSLNGNLNQFVQTVVRCFKENSYQDKNESEGIAQSENLSENQNSIEFQQKKPSKTNWAYETLNKCGEKK
jgi:predicted aminopeptidase